MKRIIATVTATAVLLLSPSCSNDDESSTSTTSTTVPATTVPEGPSPGTVSVDEWAETFCGAFADWTTGMGKLSVRSEADIPAATSPSGARDAAVAALDNALILTTSFITKIEDQEPPDMEDGEGVVETFTETFQGFADAIEASRDRAEAVDANDDDLAEQLKAISTDFGNDFDSIGDSFGEIDRKYPDPEFQRALTSACGL